MNPTFYRPSPHPSTTLKPSHPERSLAENEANRQHGKARHGSAGCAREEERVPRGRRY